MAPVWTRTTTTKEAIMTDTELVAKSKTLYEQILGIEFGPEEMLAFGRAVFTKTPWGALAPSAKIAMFRLTAALAARDAAQAVPADIAPAPKAVMEGDTDEMAIESTPDDEPDNDNATSAPPAATDEPESGGSH
jgi:hypothetical protein